MFFIQCPECGAPIAIDTASVGPDRTDLWNVEYCPACDMTFDYGDEEVTQGEEPQGP